MWKRRDGGGGIVTIEGYQLREGEKGERDGEKEKRETEGDKDREEGREM